MLNTVLQIDGRDSELKSLDTDITDVLGCGERQGYLIDDVRGKALYCEEVLAHHLSIKNRTDNGHCERVMSEAKSVLSKAISENACFNGGKSDANDKASPLLHVFDEYYVVSGFDGEAKSIAILISYSAGLNFAQPDQKDSETSFVSGKIGAETLMAKAKKSKVIDDLWFLGLQEVTSDTAYWIAVMKTENDGWCVSVFPIPRGKDPIELEYIVGDGPSDADCGHVTLNQAISYASHKHIFTISW